ncbi:MAG: hypothetical protein WKG07_14390 [Hymenobacter sp.]
MPSGTPNLTVVRPDNAAQAALRALEPAALARAAAPGNPASRKPSCERRMRS